jgi:hypothetical protein
MKEINIGFNRFTTYKDIKHQMENIQERMPITWKYDKDKKYLEIRIERSDFKIDQSDNDFITIQFTNREFYSMHEYVWTIKRNKIQWITRNVSKDND